jgi:ABC-type uncharacterized transport system permease subunit
MLFGATLGFIAAQSTESYLLGFLVGIAIGGLLGLLHGFIALALVFFSMWSPFILLGGSLLFGTLWQLSLNPQLVLPGLLSRYIWRTIPFVITIGVLLIVSTKWFRIRWGAAKPEALATPYIKE